MTVIPSDTFLIEPTDQAVQLARYFHIIDVTECAGFGVANPTDPAPGCNSIWLKSQRDMVAHALAESQEEIEQVTNYPLAPRWIASEPQRFAYPIKTRWGRVIQAGIRATSNIAIGAAVSYAADPSVIGPIATTVTNPDEITVFYPGSTNQIVPSAITIAGGNVTISIPRCRMVAEAFAANPEEGWDYSDVPPSATSPFTPTVDVKRVYNDPSTNAVLVYPHQCASGSCETCSCGEYTQTACMYIRGAEIGSIDVTPATYASGVWTASTACCRGKPEIVRLNYRAGMMPLSAQAEDAIIRLAHSKMPAEVCGCETWGRLWARDRNVPKMLTAERLNCNFGLDDGAWIAWRFANAMRLVRGHVL